MYPLNPPSGRPGGQLITSWTVPNEGNINEGFNDPIKSRIRLVNVGLSKVFASLKADQQFPECLTVSVSPERTSPEDFVQYWLPPTAHVLEWRSSCRRHPRT
jgi:hypothetical protein